MQDRVAQAGFEKLQAFADVEIVKAVGQSFDATRDQVAVEEPLEIRVGYGPSQNRQSRNVAITMRTPGRDAELAAGFLHGEGIIRTADDIVGVEADPAANAIRVELRDDCQFDLQRLERHFYTTSSCGICGKTSIEAIQIARAPALPKDEPRISAAGIQGLPERLRSEQAVFDRTGGLHAAALFDEAGNVLCLREDVGRHNAVDKLVGAQLRGGWLPLSQRGIIVSGRASFELVQKALMAGAPILAAVGAPSSLAVETATWFGMTLLGFVRDGRFNIYSGAHRIQC